MDAPRFAIVVAGGSGIRMGTPTPKQFLPLNDIPVLMHSLSAFAWPSSSIQKVLVLPDEHIPLWKELCQKHAFTSSHTIVKGGKTRYHSVKNGLEAIGSYGLVAIHDGVRPLVDRQLIERCFTAAQEHGTAIPAIKPNDSVRIGDHQTSQHKDRERVWLVQTPQVFRVETLKECYKKSWQAHFTDDASVVEWNGIRVTLVEGSPSNLKITLPTDLIVAEAILRNR